MKPSAGVLLAVLLTAAALSAAPKAEAKTADQCKGSFTQCKYRCQQMLIPTEASQCQVKCRLSENRCLDSASRDTESGKTAPVATSPSSTPSNQPTSSASVGGAGSAPCDPPHIRYNNGTCGCPSGLTGANCDEIVLH